MDCHKPRTLPAEIEDAIIDFCHADRATLKTCSLVCKAWRPSTRFHLLFTVTLTPQNAARLGDLVRASPEIVFFIRIVELRFANEDLSGLVPLLNLMSRVECLQLTPLRDQVMRDASSFALQTVLPIMPLQKLAFGFRSRFESLQQVVDSARRCPRLESLEVGGSWMKWGSISGPAQLPATLRRLTLTCDLDNFLAWFISLGDTMPEIQHLTLLHITRREVPRIVSYLRKASSLKSLVLSFRDFDAPAVFAADVDFSLNRELEQLAIEGAIPGLLECFEILLPQLCDSEALVRIELTLRVRNILLARNLFDLYEWEAMNSLLSGTTKRLALHALEPLSREPVPEVLACILDHLPAAKPLAGI